MTVPDRDVDELRREVEVAVAVVVPEVAALGAGDRDRVDRVLRRPRVEDVPLRVLDDLPSELGVLLDRRHRGRSYKRSRSTWTLPSRRNPSLSRIGADIGPAETTIRGTPRATVSCQRACTTEVYTPRPRASGTVAPPSRIAAQGANTARPKPTGSPSKEARKTAERPSAAMSGHAVRAVARRSWRSAAGTSKAAQSISSAVR